MEVSTKSLFAGLADRLRFLSARTNVLAENIANADTPSYIARDLAAPPFSARLAALRVNDPRHLQASSAGVAPAPHLAPDGEASLNGNEVSVETQMMKLSATRMDYQMASTVYRKGLEMLRLAARGGR